MNRIAIYAPGDDSEDLLRCARYAHRTGARIVTMASELPDDGAGVGGRIFGVLMDRMQSGEFDAILAVFRAGGDRRRLPSPILAQMAPCVRASMGLGQEGAPLVRLDRLERGA